MPIRSRARLRDQTLSKSQGQVARWRRVIIRLLRRRRTNPDRTSLALKAALRINTSYRNNFTAQLLRRNRISTASFSFNFNRFSCEDCLSLFWFEKKHIVHLSQIAGWPEEQTCTARNLFGVTPFVATCILLRRMAPPFRWREVEELFGKSASHLSEIFWEMLEAFLETCEHLIVSPLNASYLQAKLPHFADSIFRKSNALRKCVAFIDGTVIGVSRPGDSGYQHVLYNGNKRKRASGRVDARRYVVTCLRTARGEKT